MDRPLRELLQIRSGQFMVGSLVLLGMGLLAIQVQLIFLFRWQEQAAERRYQAIAQVSQQTAEMSRDLHAQFAIGTGERRETLAYLRVIGDRVGITAKEVRIQRDAIEAGLGHP